MIIRYVLPALAALGLLYGVFFTFTYGSAQTQKPNQLSQPPETPYANTVSGMGIIEANSRNIEVGSFGSGIVNKVFVTEGQVVKAGDPLFMLDERAAKAALESAEKEVHASAARLDNARVTLADEQDVLRRYEALKVGTVISEDKRERQRFVVKKATSALNTTQAELESAKAQRDAAKVELERLTVKAPIEGKILKVRIKGGEFINTMGSTTMPILMGNDTPLYLRVTFDENDVWRFSETAKATAALRSNKEITAPLKFIRLEPYVQPKRNLSGDNTERVDTRVLEVVYEIGEANAPLYIGQQMDVFVEVAKK